jgi:sugar/nucleoside kinase (ribokinase family)
MIHVFGTICIDRVRRVPALPSPGGYVEIESEVDMLGGEAANTANALRTWGFPVLLSGNSLGSGREAGVLRELLSAKGLTLEQCGRLRRGRTPVCDIYVTPDGERTMFGKGFSDMRRTVNPAAIPLSRGEWFTAEPNMGDVAREVSRRALEAGMKVYLMDFVRDDDPIAEGSFWQSSTDWAGTRNNTQKNVQWVKKWVDRHGCFTILSDGPNGFVAGSPDMPARAYPPFPAPTIVDTTGAGDLFRAGMLYGLQNDWPIAQCLQFASAAGCLKCRVLGATGEVPTVEEIQRHIADHSHVSDHYL